MKCMVLNMEILNIGKQTIDLSLSATNTADLVAQGLQV